jgi:molybdate transport system ATP-binding protein
LFVNPTPLVRLKACSILFDDQVALDHVDFALHSGERWILLGSNGSGKTLLLKLLAGILWPTPIGDESREYCFNNDPDSTVMDAKQHIAYVGPEFQDRYVRYEWNHSVRQVVTTGVFAEEIPRTQPNTKQQQLVVKLLKQFKLWSLRDRPFQTLSYGQRRRTLVARAFAQQATVLLLDEVFNGLDVFSARVLAQALQRKRGSGSAWPVTWIVSTHRAQDVPQAATHIATINQGRLIESTPLTARLRKALLTTAVQARSKPLQPVSSRSKRKPSLLKLTNVDLYREHRLVLRNVSWELERNRHWAILGRNGSGKSTLLKLLYGDLHPCLGGVIERAGIEPGIPMTEWKRRVGYVSPELQADYFAARNIEEVVISGRYASIGLHNGFTAADRKRAQRWLKEFGLLELAQRGPRQVSYGQLRLALLARAMMNEPELLLLDEPCDGLDPEHRQQLLSHLDKLARKGVQLVIAVHDRNDLPSCVTLALAIQVNKTVQVVKVK